MSRVKKTLTGDTFTVSHTVGHRQSGIRLDAYLKMHYPGRSRESLKRAIDRGVIEVIRSSKHHTELGALKASTALHDSDQVLVISKRQPEPSANFDYKVLYEDEAIIVIEKPSNLLVHPVGRFFYNTLLIHMRTEGFTKELKAEKQFLLVHRIDRETSGILLMAKTREACAHLHEQFRLRETKKYYLAIVHGQVKEKNFTVDQPLGKKPESMIALKAYPLTKEQGGLESLTEFELVETRGNFSLIACFPRTGRQHQIRVHALVAGHPLVGDKIYGLTDAEVSDIMDTKHRLAPVNDDSSEELPSEVLESASGGEVAESESGDEDSEIPDATSSIPAEIMAKLILPRHALHAAGLRFKHPTTNEWMTFESDLPQDLKDFYEKIDGKPIPHFRTKGW